MEHVLVIPPTMAVIVNVGPLEIVKMEAPRTAQQVIVIVPKDSLAISAIL